MIYDNLTFNNQWIEFVNISWTILLIVLLSLSFIRKWFACKKISKTYRLINHISIYNYDFGKRLFAASAISELMTYMYFCFIFELVHYDYPTIPLINGLSIVVWDYNTRFDGIIQFFIGIFIWIILSVVFTILFLMKFKFHIPLKDKIMIGLSSSFRNLPFYFVFQVLLIIFMWFRVQDLHYLSTL